MLILGIDPGLNKTGWGIIKASGNQVSFVACGTVCSDAKSPMAERLLSLQEGISAVIKLHRPDEAAIEETFLNKNALSSLKLGHARGALMLTVSLAGLRLREYAAKKVKKAVVGVGAADKDQVAAMIKRILPAARIGGPDEADALAVALCHLNHGNVEKFMEKAAI